MFENAIPILMTFTRIAALSLTAPILGSQAVSFRYRILIAAALTIGAFPVVNSIATESTIQNADIVSMLISEATIGLSLGWGTMIVFSAAQFAGNAIGQMAGFNFMDQTNVSGAQSSSVGQFFSIVSIAAFALMDGPELVMSSLLGTFRHLPPGTSFASADLLALITQLLQQSFTLTLRGIGPAVAAMFITHLVLGLISRSFPQIDLTGFGFGSNVAVMWLAMFLCVGGCVWLFVDDFGSTIQSIESTLASARN